MCGRFQIDFEESDELAKIVHTVQRKLDAGYYGEKVSLKSGEIFPTDAVPVLHQKNDKIMADLAVWGYPQSQSSGVIINARAETAQEKRMFEPGLKMRRCIIPSSGFYEWNQSKKKYYVRRKESKVLYMAGFYQLFPDETTNRFVILTTQANESMETIHHRMPIILNHDQIRDWLEPGPKYQDLLKSEMPQLKLQPIDQQYEQISLF